MRDLFKRVALRLTAPKMLHPAHEEAFNRGASTMRKYDRVVGGLKGATYVGAPLALALVVMNSFYQDQLDNIDQGHRDTAALKKMHQADGPIVPATGANEPPPSRSEIMDSFESAKPGTFEYAIYDLMSDETPVIAINKHVLDLDLDQPNNPLHRRTKIRVRNLIARHNLVENWRIDQREKRFANASRVSSNTPVTLHEATQSVSIPVAELTGEIEFDDGAVLGPAESDPVDAPIKRMMEPRPRIARELPDRVVY